MCETNLEGYESGLGGSWGSCYGVKAGMSWLSAPCREMLPDVFLKGDCLLRATDATKAKWCRYAHVYKLSSKPPNQKVHLPS